MNYYIILNGRVFARNAALLTRTLFEPVNGQTACGTFKATKNSIYLHDATGARVGFINRHGVCGIASKQNDGRYWYSYGTPAILGEWPSLMAEGEDVDRALRECGIKLVHPVYFGEPGAIC